MNRLLAALFCLFLVVPPTFGEAVTMQPFFNTNKAAFVTTTSLAVLTGASAVGALNATNTANTFALVSYSALALTGVALSIAAITAWVSLWDVRSTADAGTYFDKLADDATLAVAGVAQFSAMMLTNAVVQGLTQGTSRRISRAVGGEDQRIRIVR